MTEKYKILKKIKHGDVLDDEQIRAIADLKACVHNVYDDENAEYDAGVCYLYATLAEHGYIEEDSCQG